MEETLVSIAADVPGDGGVEVVEVGHRVSVARHLSSCSSQGGNKEAKNYNWYTKYSSGKARILKTSLSPIFFATVESECCAATPAGVQSVVPVPRDDGLRGSDDNDDDDDYPCCLRACDAQVDIRGARATRRREPGEGADGASGEGLVQVEVLVFERRWEAEGVHRERKATVCISVASRVTRQGRQDGQRWRR